MKLKKVKVFLTALLILVSALSVNFYAFATEEEEDFVIDEITTQATTAAPTTVNPANPAGTLTNISAKEAIVP
jgi:uncharacterized membrane-anchored protein